MGLAKKEALHEDNYLQFVDPQGEVAGFVAGLDIFVMTSFAEGVPTALLEAMAAGIPVVATRAGGVSEVVEHGVTGYLCEVGDLDELEAKLSLLVNDSQKRLEFGAAAKRAAAERFDAIKCAGLHLSLIHI